VNRFSFVLRRSAITMAIASLALATVACSSPSPSASAGSGATITVTNGAATITAANLEFDASVIEATAGEDFTITLVNDDSAPHNLSIYTEEGGELLVQGDTAEAGQSITIDVSALDAGTYYFQCDIHPDMNGSVEVSG
jgi:plastocyanin